MSLCACLYILIYLLWIFKWEAGQQLNLRAWASGLVMVNSDVLRYYFHMVICRNKLCPWDDIWREKHLIMFVYDLICEITGETLIRNLDVEINFLRN